MKSTKYIIGIDEVGRGPIAGPVAVGAFRIDFAEYKSFIEKAKEDLNLPLRDSKKLTALAREKWFVYLKNSKDNNVCDYAVSYVSNDNIDKFGISKAIKKALETSLEKVSEGIVGSEIMIYLDGGLKAPERFQNQETVIKGDELHPIISCASIVAKVSRDRVMVKYAKEHPTYGFESHMGYGTKKHYEAIEKYGVTPLHRKTYLKSI